MKIFSSCFLLTVVIACGVKIAPSPYLADKPNRFDAESKKRVEAEAARVPAKPKTEAPTPTPTPTLTPTPFPSESPQPETLRIPPQ